MASTDTNITVVADNLAVEGLTGHIPRKTDFEDTGGPFYLDPHGKHPDLIADDLALWIRTDQGLVICLGCCHAGLVNTIHHIRSISGTEIIRAIIGGFHLLHADSRRIEGTTEVLRASPRASCFSTPLCAICYSLPMGRIVSTGQGAVRATRSVTDPNTKR